MTLNTPAAHLLCLALASLDLGAHALRIRVLVRGVGEPLSIWDAFVMNAFGEAASALTPMRLGGEPARLLGLVRAGVTTSAAITALAVEALAGYPVVILAALGLSLVYAPTWSRAAAPAMFQTLRDHVALMALVVGGFIALWIAARRLTPRSRSLLRRLAGTATADVRRMNPWSVAASIPLTVLHVGARVAILPVLASTLSSPPPFGATLLGSFALLYGQLLLPTPAGAGIIDLGFLGGIAGPLGARGAALLLAWRVYTLGIALAVGLMFGLPRYGPWVISSLFRRSSASASPTASS